VRGALRLLAPASLALVLACAGAQPPGRLPPSSSDSPARSKHQIMVTLREAPARIWEQRLDELALNYDLSLVHAWKMQSLGELCAVFEGPTHRKASDLASDVAADTHVTLAQPIQLFTTLESRDQYRHLQHSADTLRLGAAHRLATGRGVRVAVVDTGVDLDHPDLRGRVVGASNFVDGGEQTFTGDIHGTAVAGALAASANEVGIVGVAPDAQLLALKACWPESPGARQALCNSYTLAKAVDFALNARAQVLNLSLAGPADPLLTRLLVLALERGITVVAAAPADGAPSFPASLAGVVAVRDGGIGSSTGAFAPAVKGGAESLAAPAVDILTTVPRASYDYFSGSSVAAAQVSGIAALLLERQPGMKPAEVRELLLQTAHAQGDSVGVADACAPLAELAGGASCE
jgi:subtilisin family serine protease